MFAPLILAGKHYAASKGFEKGAEFMKTNQLLLFAALGAGAWYYFKVYKPKQALVAAATQSPVMQLSAGSGYTPGSFTSTPGIVPNLDAATALANAAMASLDDGTQALRPRALLPNNNLMQYNSIPQGTM